MSAKLVLPVHGQLISWNEAPKVDHRLSLRLLIRSEFQDIAVFFRYGPNEELEATVGEVTKIIVLTAEGYDSPWTTLEEFSQQGKTFLATLNIDAAMFTVTRELIA